MHGLIKAIITITLTKFTSIIDKKGYGYITDDQTHDLVKDLIANTAAEVSRNTRAGFVTDN